MRGTGPSTLCQTASSPFFRLAPRASPPGVGRSGVVRAVVASPPPQRRHDVGPQVVRVGGGLRGRRFSRPDAGDHSQGGEAPSPTTVIHFRTRHPVTRPFVTYGSPFA